MSTPTPKTGSSGARAGDPNIAVLLTWLVPGAGHLFLGRITLAVAAFLLVEGVYWLGVRLSNGMFLEYLPPELRSRFAAALAPEVGNAGSLYLHQRVFGYGTGQPRPWPATMDWGTLCTAFSGVLNLFVMAHAHFAARTPKLELPLRRSPAFLAFATWLMPGLGHLMQGRRLRAVLVGVSLVGLFLLGTWLAQGSNLDRERHFYYWSGQFLLGLPAILAEVLHGHPLLRSEIYYGDAGVVIACLAGMLNVLCMLDVYGWSEQRLLAPAASSTPVPQGTPA